MEPYTINQGNDQKYQWANIFFVNKIQRYYIHVKN